MDVGNLPNKIWEKTQADAGIRNQAVYSHTSSTTVIPPRFPEIV